VIPAETEAGIWTGSSGLRISNQVLLSLTIVGTAAACGAGFVALAPNRLVSGTPIALWRAVGIASVVAMALLGALLLATALLRPRPALHRIAAGLAAALLLLVLNAAGQAATHLSANAVPVARVSLGAGFWALSVCAALAVVDGLQRARTGPVVQLLAAAVLAGAVFAMAQRGAFAGLSLAREYAARRDIFGAAVLRHLVLVAASVGPALVIGVPLGVAAARRPGLRGPLFALLNLLQTIPSVALFGLLIVPLSALATAVPALARLGVGGIGPAPAIIALVLYALLPVVRNTDAGLAGVDPAVVEAGSGMGLTRRQLLWRVELPLALPVLLAGLRIVTVQAIGLAVVAALIGAGGLGTFVFQGLGQYAVDLVLLGALPAIFLALAADFLLRVVSGVLRRSEAR